MDFEESILCNSLFYVLQLFAVKIWMKFLIFFAAIFPVIAMSMPDTHGAEFPSCNLAKQRTLTEQKLGGTADRMQAHVSLRANVLQADVGAARKRRHITQHNADRLLSRVEKVREGANDLVKKQGFLSAAERASYDREFDAIAQKICKH